MSENEPTHDFLNDPSHRTKTQIMEDYWLVWLLRLRALVDDEGGRIDSFSGSAEDAFWLWYINEKLGAQDENSTESA